MIKEQNENQSLIKRLAQLLIILVAGIGISNLLLFRFSSKNSPPVASKSNPAMIAVTGLGRLEPEGEVIHLSAPTSIQGTRVKRILVKEGEKVQLEQVVAILDTYESRLAALNRAKQQVKIAKARLAKVKAGAQTGEIAAQQATIARLEAESRGEIAAQQATIARLEAELSNAEAENRRYEELYQTGAISASARDSKRLPMQTAQQQLKEAKATLKRTVTSYREQIAQAKATLNRIVEVRPEDVRLAQAEVDDAIAQVQQAQADYNLAYVRSPINGKVLKIHTRAGEIVSNQGIANIGKTNQMYVVAEIYETDIKKVQIGQQATITSVAFPGKLQGTVSQIGLQVSKQNVFDVNPLADTDQKVVEVKIRISDPEDSQRVARLTNLQVQVMIHI
ncbi:MAG: ABC exporter membrane fusion protein [Chlorogloeopsis fritschii C42_A2020_084]|uniref:ABC exporter membrane fusion protein n=1 Tax=Chlorogloeopsis fritschii TaxID=1124 RepID=UPI0019EC5A5E|nr:ABC exporter membrane fusion protein [Chlorogloeopsis fritschii]MBF2008965.1 ABC exporter membrane fusion protein [Chlorogloeopsis fritschii C42_A2020_084]